MFFNFNFKLSNVNGLFHVFIFIEEKFVCSLIVLLLSMACTLPTVAVHVVRWMYLYVMQLYL